jgi:hypothetical protein
VWKGKREEEKEEGERAGEGEMMDRSGAVQSSKLTQRRQGYY